jgi:gliding motility-associated-like protein
MADMAIDTVGNIWLGFVQAVVKYDGINWTKYDTTNSALPYGITCFEVDTITNIIYGGYWGGVYKYGGNQWVEVLKSNTNFDVIYCENVMVNSSNDVINAYGNGNSLHTYNGTEWTKIVPPINFNDSIWYNTISNNAVLKDRLGNIWVGLRKDRGGIVKYNGTDWKHFLPFNLPINGGRNYQNHISNIIQDEFGNIFANSATHLFKIEANSDSLEIITNHSLEKIYYLKVDKKKNLWIVGTVDEQMQLWKYYNGNFERINTSAIYSNGYINWGFAEDDFGNFWLDSYDGLMKVDSLWSKFELITTPFTSYEADAVVVDNYNNILVATYRGLHKFDGINWSLYNQFNSGLLCAPVVNVAVDENNCYWLATYGEGINVFCCPQPESNPFDSVYFICPESEILLSIPQNFYAEILWSNGDNGYASTFVDTGLVWVYTKDKDGCSQTHKTRIKYYPQQEVLISDTSICFGETITLSLDRQFSNVIWSNGYESHNAEINEAGSYFVSFTDANNCNRQHYFNVVEKSKPYIYLGDDIDSICIPPYTIYADSLPYSYLWSTGDTIYYTVANESGIYSLQVSNECGTYTDSIEINFFDTDMLKIYTAFSPNGDGIHDVFYIPNSYSNLFFELKIYDLTGQLVFYSNDINQGWDGTNNNTPVASGTYGYVLTVLCDGIPLFKRGTILVLN